MSVPARTAGAGLATALAAATALLAGCASGTVAARTTTAPAPTPGSTWSPTDAVGPLFAAGTSQPHNCTATVVRSSSRDIAMTAAHCISGTAAGLTFVPGYDRGHEPFGEWNVVGVQAPAGWRGGENTDDDVAFLVLAPRQRDGATVHVQDVSGGVGVEVVPPLGRTVTVIGYPAGIDDAPLRCTTPVVERASSPSVDCRGFASGTSGSPWLTDSDGWSAIGLIGGRHQGGCLVDRSFSPTFASDVLDALAAAERPGASEVVPAAGDDGC
ncbi:trypsin-like serine peptidase [Jatrophihabitans sp. YIM 134969]